jgi:hypothetical protein
VSYSTSAVKIYNATNIKYVLKKTNIFFYLEKNVGVIVVNSEIVGLDPSLKHVVQTRHEISAILGLFCDTLFLCHTTISTAVRHQSGLISSCVGRWRKNHLAWK